MIERLNTITRQRVLGAAFMLLPFNVQPAFAQQNAAASDASQAAGEMSSDEPAALRDRIVFLLSAYHGAPTREKLGDLGSKDAIAGVLQDIAADGGLRPSMRLRAVDSIGHLGDVSSTAFLEALIETPATIEVQRERDAQALRRHAIVSYARIRGDEGLSVLLPLVEADELQLRMTAVSALGRFGGEAGMAELARLRARIEHPALKRSLNKFVEPSSP